MALRVANHLRVRSIRLHTFLLNFDHTLMCGMSMKVAGAGSLTLHMNSQQADDLSGAAHAALGIAHKKKDTAKAVRLSGLCADISKLASKEPE